MTADSTSVATRDDVTTAPPADVAARRGPRTDIALLRVLAICGVVLIHVSGLTVINPRVRGTTVWWLAEVLNIGSRFCVPLFVMVSGALLLRPGTHEPARAFYARRLDRLVPALVVWYAAYVVFTLVVLDRPGDPTRVIAGVVAGKTYTALYFFWLILGLYLATPALRKLLQGLDGDAVLRAGVLLTALTCAWQSAVIFIATYGVIIDASASPNAFSYWLPYVGYFVLGAALAQRSVPRRALRWAVPAFVLSTALTTWVASGRRPRGWNVVFSASYQGWLVAVATASLFVAVVALASGWSGEGRLARVLHVLGNLTLGVFAMHLMVLYGLQHAGFLSVTKGASRLLELGYLAGATLVVAFALSWLMSHLPLLRRLV